MWNRQFIALCLILLAAGIVTAPIQLLFPVYVEDSLGKTVWFTAMLRAVPIALGGLFALVGGALSDHLGRKSTLVVGMTGALVAGVIFVSKRPLLIVGILCYQGIASGIQTTGGQSYLIGAVNAAQLGFATAIYFLTHTLGGAIGNAFGGELIERFGYETVGVGAVVLMCLVIFAALMFLPNLSSGAKAVQREPFGQMLAGYRRLLERREMRLVLGMRFLPTYYWGTVNLLLPVLINRAANVKMAAYYGTLSLLFAACCQLFTGRVCDVVGTRITAVITTCLVTLSAGVIALYTHSILALYVAGILGAGAAWSLSVTMPRFINEFSAETEKGRGVGITHLAWSAGYLSGHIVSGWLESVSISLPFAVAGGLVAVSVMLAFLLWIDGERS